MGAECSGCRAQPQKEIEICQESSLPIKSLSVQANSQYVAIAQTDHDTSLKNQEPSFSTISEDNLCVSLSSKNADVFVEQETVAMQPNLEVPISKAPRRSRFSVQFDVQKQIKTFILEEAALLQERSADIREQEVSSGFDNTAKLKSSVVHRVKRESFVRMKMENINDKYVFAKKVGQGAYGSVFIAKSKKLDQQMAIKIISKSKIHQNQESLLSELMILRTLDHPNIVKLFEVYDNKSHYYVVTEVCRGGDLLQYARSRVNSQRYIAKVMRQLLSAVNYLHKRQIVHRDLKSENILFEEKPEPEVEPIIKIIDFGTSIYFTPGKALTEKVGSPYYVAPEVLQQSYNQKCDIWSCGVILYVMLSGAPPFGGTSRKQIFNNILNSKLTFKGSGMVKVDKAWQKINPQAKDLIRKMMEREVDRRPGAEECLKHPWLCGIFSMKESVSKFNADEILSNMQNFFFKDRFLAVVKTYVASLLTSQKDKRELAEKFREIDKDHSGMLEANEIFQAYRQLHGAITEDFIQDIVRRLDTNGSGKIDFTEFIVAADRHNRVISQEAVESAFNYFDKDGTGFLEINQLRQLLGSAEDAQINAIMQRLDLNHDNKVSREEFVRHVLNEQL